MGSVRLLLASKEKGWLPDLSNQVGCYVRTNSESILVAEAPASTQEDWTGHVAINSGIQVDPRTHIEMVRFNPGSDSLFWLATALTDGGGSVPRPLRLLGNLIRHPLRTLKNLWPFGRARRAGIVLAMQSTDGHLDLRV